MNKILCIRLKYDVATAGTIIIGPGRMNLNVDGSITVTPPPFSPVKECYKDSYFEKYIKDKLVEKYFVNENVGEEYKIVITPTEVNYFEEILNSEPSVDQREIENFKEIIGSLKDGRSIEMWLKKNEE